MKFNLSGVNTTTVVRTILTLLVMVNMFLGYMGVQLIPVNETAVHEVVNAVVVLITAGVWLWGWWKNNSFTMNAQRADDYLKKLNNGEM